MPFRIEIYSIERIAHGQGRDGIHWFGNKTLIHTDQLERDLFSMFSDNPSPGNIKNNVVTVTGKTNLSSNIIIIKDKFAPESSKTRIWCIIPFMGFMT